MAEQIDGKLMNLQYCVDNSRQSCYAYTPSWKGSDADLHACCNPGQFEGTYAGAVGGIDLSVVLE